VPGSELEVSAIGFSLDGGSAGTPDALRSVGALLRAARARGVTTFDLPEGPDADRLERLIAGAFPDPDPMISIIAQRSAVGIESGVRPHGGAVESPESRDRLGRSIDASNRRLAPQRVGLLEWTATEGEDPKEIDEALTAARGSHGVTAVIRRTSAGEGPTPPSTTVGSTELLSGSLSLLDTRLLRRLEPAASTGRIGFFARDPLGAGRLDGTRLSESVAPRRPDAGPVRVRELEREFAPVLALGFLTEGRRRTLAQASIRFVLRFPWVCSALVPTPSPERLDEVLRSESVPELSASELERLDQLLPGT
jgi:L-glyceraldehyde 3-phosphate reductase